MIRLGDIRLDALWEMNDHSFDAQGFFPLSTSDDWASNRHWLEPMHYDATSGRIALSMHSWLVRTPRATILIDGCIGNDKHRPTRPNWHHLDIPYLERLAALGVAPEQVDYVMCTHLHADHVGWNTRLLDGRWVPTFPKAKYVISRKDHDDWAARLAAAGGQASGHHLQSFVDSVLPVVEAGQALLVDDGFELDGALTIEPAPGHTPHHVAIWLKSGDRSGVFTGDVIHSPIQVHNPHWSCIGCEDPDLATATRKRLLHACAEQDALLLPAHFMAPHATRITEKGSRFDFHFVEGDEA